MLSCHLSLPHNNPKVIGPSWLSKPVCEPAMGWVDSDTSDAIVTRDGGGDWRGT
jgi:hypothetical protein